MGDSESEISAERERLMHALAAARSAGVELQFWWRDDDAVSITPQLEELLQIRADAGVPLALAVIPKFAERALIDRLKVAESIGVMQHGWAHAKNSPAGEKASEFGASRPLEASLADLRSVLSKASTSSDTLSIKPDFPPRNIASMRS